MLDKTLVQNGSYWGEKTILRAESLYNVKELSNIFIYLILTCLAFLNHFYFNKIQSPKICIIHSKYDD